MAKAPTAMDPSSVKLSKLLGGQQVRGTSAGKIFDVLNARSQSRFKRDIIKPLDLTHFIILLPPDKTSAGIDPEVLKDLETACEGDAEGLKSIVDGLNDLHLHCVPKMGCGYAGVHVTMEKAGIENPTPVRTFWENGARIIDTVDLVPFMKATVPCDRVGNELMGLDLTEGVISGTVATFVKDPEAINQPGFVKASLEATLAEMQADKQNTGGENQPMMDNYKNLMPFGILLPGKSPCGCVSDLWHQMEDMVEEGKVRTLGISNHTVHQIRELFKVCKIRPAMVHQETHILNQIPEFVAFCHEMKMAVVAAVPLAKGDLLTSKELIHPEMTPAQAALHWNMKRHVSVIPGVDNYEHIIENCGVLSKMHLEPINPPTPTVVLRKVYPIWENGAGGHLLKYGTERDAGIFRNENGKLYPDTDTSRESSVTKSIDILSDTQKKLLADVGKAIAGLDIGMMPHTKRVAVNSHVSNMTDDAGSAAPSVVHHKQHEMRAAAHRNLTSMVVVPLSKFIELGKIPRRSVNTPETNMHIPIDNLTADDKVLFFSQRWLTPAPTPEVPTANPDDADLTKFKQIVASAQAWGEANGIQEDRIYVWVDFCCIEQDDFEELIRGVNSLALYVCSVDAFITIEHEVYFDRGWCLMECLFADSCKVPRFIYKHIGKEKGELTTLCVEDRLALKKPHDGTFTVESDRDIMELLELLAVVITGKLERGAMMEELDGSHQANKIEHAALNAAEMKAGGPAAAIRGAIR